MMTSWPVVPKSLLVIASFFFAVIIFDVITRGLNQVKSEETTHIVEQPLIVLAKHQIYRPEKVKKEIAKGHYNMDERMDLTIKANIDPLPPRTFSGHAMELCEGNSSVPNRCLPAFKRFETRMKVSPQYKMASCIIQKSMSTVMTAIMCYLFNETNFRAAGREFAKECILQRFCSRKNEFSSMNATRVRLGIHDDDMKDWRFTLITRDPIDRFLSGFVDKCIRSPQGAGYCNGCGRNMTCFLITEYDRILKQIQKRRFPKSFEDRHFFPQNWRCDLHKEYDNYKFIRYSSDPGGSFLQEFLPILIQQKVPQSSIDFITSEINKERTDHTTVKSEARAFLEKRLLSSPFLLEYLVRIFYHDFKLFNYALPEGF